MSSVPDVENQVQTILNERACVLAREVGCVQRQRKFDGASLVQTLIFSFLKEPHPALETMASMAAIREVYVSDTAVDKRFSKPLALLLHRVLQELCQVVVRAQEPAPFRLLRRFSSVEIQDSSTIVLPDEFEEHWRGLGSAWGYGRSSVKLHVRWDLTHGRIWGPTITDGRAADQKSEWLQEPVVANSLEVADLNYLNVARIARRRLAHAYSLTRYQMGLGLYDKSGQKINIERLLPQKMGQHKEVWVRVGYRDRVSMRLLMLRVPDEVREQRQRRIKRQAQVSQRPITPLTWKLAGWTLLLTDAPAKKLHLEEALVLMRERWQIEVLWKLWKQEGQIDEWWTDHSWRVLCELYAKLIGVLLQQWMITLFAWQDGQRSLVKLAKVVRESAPGLMEALAGLRSLDSAFLVIQRRMQAGCSMNKRRTRPNSGQLLDEGFVWEQAP